MRDIRNLFKSKLFYGPLDIAKGRLTGTTDTDYFYFVCPNCPRAHVLQLVDYEVTLEAPADGYPEIGTEVVRIFVVRFYYRCKNCGRCGFFKIGNIGWQMGSMLDNPMLRGEKIRLMEIETN